MCEIITFITSKYKGVFQQNLPLADARSSRTSVKN
jgi:hypothetical protein